MSKQQAEWARGHDWFYGIEEYEDGQYQVWVLENGKHHPWPFQDYQELRAWAGY